MVFSLHFLIAKLSHKPRILFDNAIGIRKQLNKKNEFLSDRKCEWERSLAWHISGNYDDFPQYNNSKLCWQLWTRVLL